MFSIECKRLYWLDDNGDDPQDLCAHGDVLLRIGEEMISYPATVSATALYLLKSLSEDHIAGEREIRILPRCGHFFYLDEKQQAVITGLHGGIDWSVVHTDGGVNIITEAGRRVFVPMVVYRDTVCRFADEVEEFYKQSAKKIVHDDTLCYIYAVFWREWRDRRRLAESVTVDMV